MVPKKGNAGIPRDLETICLKCLEKAPEKRYQSASEFSDDLGRYLQGIPIKARRIGKIARGWRWAKRNSSVASLSVGILLVLVAGIGATSYWAIRSNRNENLAEEKSRQAIRSLVSALSTARPSVVPITIEAIRPFRDEALPMLAQQFADATDEHKLHMAYGLADFRQVEAEFLVDSIGTADSGECDNLVAASIINRNVQS